MRIKVNGSHIFFDVEGAKVAVQDGALREKPTLILLHGAPGLSDHTSFKPYLSALADVAQLIYVDLSGAGRSGDDPREGSSLEGWADDLVAFCEALEIVLPVVLGHSAGGFVAATYASLYPDHPLGIVLSSTQAKLTPARCVRVFERLGGAAAKEAAEQFFSTPMSPESMAGYATHCLPLYSRTRHQASKPLSAYRAKVAKEFHDLGGIWGEMNLLESLGRIRCPTLILAGEDDPVTPLEDSEDIVERLRPELARFERFPRCGHGVWVDEPERAFSVIGDFIRSLPAGSAGESARLSES